MWQPCSLIEIVELLGGRVAGHIGELGELPGGAAFLLGCVGCWPCAEMWVGWGEILGMGVRPRWNR